MNPLLRLLWALPLVLAVGVAGMLVLRRFLAPAAAPRGAMRVVLRETLALSEHSRVHLLEIDGGGYLIVESAQNATLQPLSSPVREAGRRPVAWRPRGLPLGAAR